SWGRPAALSGALPPPPSPGYPSQPVFSSAFRSTSIVFLRTPRIATVWSALSSGHLTREGDVIFSRGFPGRDNFALAALAYHPFRRGRKRVREKNADPYQR